mgnify:CR=1 FL=1
MRRRKTSPTKPEAGRIRKYLLPKPEEFRAVAKAVSKASGIQPEDLFIVSMLIDELEKAAERVKSGEDYWKALLDWAMGVVKFQRRVGVRRLQKLFALISEVYEKR